MPGEAKSLCVDDLRHAEYYGMQPVFDELYRKSKSGEIFTNLMEIILRRENILLAYRNIKTNGGSYTAGTDNRNITDIGSRTPKEVVEKVRFIVTGSRHGYRPKPVRRKDIPKPNGKTRPLGIPCIWDRLIQQCIKQVMEPICEAQFSDNSYGFRPNRSVEHAIARTYSLMQVTHLHYVIEFDIKGLFRQRESQQADQTDMGNGNQGQAVDICNKADSDCADSHAGRHNYPTGQRHATGRHHLAATGKHRAERTGSLGREPMAEQSGGCSPRKIQDNR